MNWRHCLDATIATLAAIVALYHRVPASKRIAFEQQNPRLASVIGIIAGIVPFIPMITAGIKGALTGTPPPSTLPPPIPSTDNDAPTVEVDSGN